MSVSLLHRGVTNRATDAKVLTWVARLFVLVTAILLIPSLTFVLITLLTGGWGVLLMGAYLFGVVGALVCGLPVALIGLIYLEIARRTGLRPHLVLGAIAGLASAVTTILLLGFSSGERPALGPTFALLCPSAIGGVVCGLLVALVYHGSDRLIERWIGRAGRAS